MRVVLPVIFLLLVLAVVSIDVVFCAFTLHVPRRNAGSAPSGFQDAFIQARDGATLAAWFVPSSLRNGRCVMVLHGIGDSRQGSAGYFTLFHDAGYSVLLPDSRGHGDSGGDLVTYGLLEKYDVLDWSAWLRRKGCRSIYGLGESLGGAVLIQATAVRPEFNAIIAECAYSDLRSIARYRVTQMSRVPQAIAGPLVIETTLIYARMRYGLDLGNVSPVESIRKTDTPILLIHGLADQQTPPWHSQVLAEANSEVKLWLVPGADHAGAYAQDPPEFKRKVLAWFNQH